MRVALRASVCAGLFRGSFRDWTDGVSDTKWSGGLRELDWGAARDPSAGITADWS